MRSSLVAAIGVAGALIGGGCVDQGSGPQPKRVDPGFVGKHLLQAPPPMTATLDVTLGGKVVYLGNTIDVERAVPGAALKITHYWKVLAPVGPGWQVFSLLRGEPNKPDFMNLPATEMQRAHGPATWTPGEIIEDEQEIFVRPDWRSHEATLLVGLIQVGAHGVGDRMAATGAQVKDRAVIAHKLDVDLSKAPPPPGTVNVPYARGPIAIDGMALDEGWMGVAQSPDWLTAEGSPEPVGKATGRMTWDEQNLYVFANVVDSEVFSEFKNQDDPLWKQDAIEMFIDADGNRRGYVELQVNPNNATFDSWFAQGRAAKGDEAWDSGMVTAVKLNPNQGWDVEIAIPWAAIKGKDDAMSVRLPPQVGDRWRMNLVRVDKKTAAQNPTASSWNRITYQDWHGLDRMLTVVFADIAGGVVPGTNVRPLPPPGTGAGSGSAAAGSGTVSEAAPGAALEIVVRLDAVLVGGKVIDDTQLDQLMRAAYARDKTTAVTFISDPGVGHARMVQLLDRAKLVGLTRVAVGTPGGATGATFSPGSIVAPGSAKPAPAVTPRAPAATGSGAQGSGGASAGSGTATSR
ncbi:MAG: putative lipoprotein [Myxococcales bacterium]|nr:putative lipoprotein [Myxococcales bacterium]